MPRWLAAVVLFRKAPWAFTTVLLVTVILVDQASIVFIKTIFSRSSAVLLVAVAVIVISVITVFVIVVAVLLVIIAILLALFGFVVSKYSARAKQ